MIFFLKTMSIGFLEILVTTILFLSLVKFGLVFSSWIGLA